MAAVPCASFRLIISQGHEIYPRSKSLLEWLPVTVAAFMLWILLRIGSFRVLATGENECCALVDAMMESAVRKESSIEYKTILAMEP